MADNTPIEWTDASWNPLRARNAATGKVGWFCTHVSEGCRNCYAEGFNRRLGTGVDYKPQALKAGQVELFLDPVMLTQPLRWKKPRMIFVCSMTDAFADFVTDDQLDQIFAIAALCPQHTFQFLTKRPERMRDYLGEAGRGQLIMDHVRAWIEEHVDPLNRRSDDLRATGLDPVADDDGYAPLPNVWLGVSVEDQARADERIPVLLDTPAAVRWISAEPLLGPVDLEPWLSWKGDYLPGAEDRWWGCGSCDTDCPTCPRQKAVFTYPEGPADADGAPEWIAEHRMTLDWVVAGGESGPGARPMHPDWARQLRDQCAAAGVPFLFKQWGAWAPDEGPPEAAPDRIFDGSAACAKWRDTGWTYAENGYAMPIQPDDCGAWVYRLGKKAAGRLLDGVQHDGFPEAR